MRYMELTQIQRLNLRREKGLLLKGYEELSKYLSTRYPEAVERTRSEQILAQEIKIRSRINVSRSFWIGRYNCDFFFPYSCYQNSFNPSSYGERRKYRGIVIEIDGGIHFRYDKMNKDNSKYQVLDRLNIALVSLHNEDVIKKNSTVSSMLNAVISSSSMDYRAKNRLMRDIYISSIVSNRKSIEENNLHECMKVINVLERQW